MVRAVGGKGTKMSAADRLEQDRKRVLKYFLETWGVTIGSVVECPLGDLLVLEIEGKEGGAKPALVGVLRNKANKWGLRRHRVVLAWKLKKEQGDGRVRA